MRTREELYAAIEEHREEHLRLDKAEIDHITKELDRGSADIKLWSNLDD